MFCTPKLLIALVISDGVQSLNWPNSVAVSDSCQRSQKKAGVDCLPFRVVDFLILNNCTRKLMKSISLI
jgi:hypothetical protein